MATTFTGKLLIVDDDRSMTEVLAEVLRDKGFTVHTAVTGGEAVEIARAEQPDIIVSDMRMSPMGGIEVLRTLRGELPETTFILMTAFGTLESAIEAMHEGAYDYVSKPFKFEELLLVIERAVESKRITSENKRLKFALRENLEVTDIIGRSPKMIEVFKEIARAAPSPAAVLIQGETGVGKEVVARALHGHSPRKQKPFLAVNCAALPENLLESELFGHEKGAFTGAVVKKTGLFQQADTGTILLDEIGDMPLALQSKLLRILQSGEVRAVGATTSTIVDVRVIASTNRNLRAAVAEGTFREDLLFRLNTLTIRVPPLRERLEDIPILVERFIGVAAARVGKSVGGISKEALKILKDHDWPGNVRELEHVIDRAVAFARQDLILPEDLPQELSEARTSRLMSLEEMEKRHILHVLKSTQGNRNRAAEILGIDRKTLYRKLLKYGMDEGEEPGPEGGSTA